MTAHTRRFKVQYARPDGNVYDVYHSNGTVMEPFYLLDTAQAIADIERCLHRDKGWTSAVFITDLDNPERGDLSNTDPEDYE